MTSWQKKNIIQYKIIASSIYYSRPSIYKSNLSMNNVLQMFYCVFVYAMLTTQWLTKFVFYIFSSVFCVLTDEVTYCIGLTASWHLSYTIFHIIWYNLSYTICDTVCQWLAICRWFSSGIVYRTGDDFILYYILLLSFVPVNQNKGRTRTNTSPLFHVSRNNFQHFNCFSSFISKTIRDEC
jgi:hypothetical protein